MKKPTPCASQEQTSSDEKAEQVVSPASAVFTSTPARGSEEAGTTSPVWHNDSTYVPGCRDCQERAADSSSAAIDDEHSPDSTPGDPFADSFVKSHDVMRKLCSQDARWNGYKDLLAMVAEVRADAIAGLAGWLRSLGSAPQDPTRLADEIEATSRPRTAKATAPKGERT
jgi:hypothetical protein